jgi:hypothetical protein
MFNNTADAITLENVTITGGNVNDGPGGGGIHLDQRSDLTVLNSAIINNLTCEQGGGIELDEGGNLTVKNSTISGNTATDTDGGGIAHVGSDPTDKMIIINSTISNNTSVEAGGIEVDAGSLQLVYATVTDNTVNPNLVCPPALESLGKPAAAGRDDKHEGAQPQATAGIPANVRVEDSTIQILTSFGTVVAFPHGGPNCDSFNPLPLANTVSQGWNFSDDDSCGFTNTASGDKQNAGDPMIGALANNQPTSVTMPAPARQTRLPLTGSPLTYCTTRFAFPSSTTARCSHSPN